MARTKINFQHPRTKKRTIGCLNTQNGRVRTAKGDNYSLSYLKKKDKEGVGFFETHKNGKLVQKQHEYKK